MRRQQLLHNDPPLELTVVLDESVLRRKMASAPVMRRQLLHLIRVAKFPNVTLRVLRLNDEIPIIMESFDLLRFG